MGAWLNRQAVWLVGLVAVTAVALYLLAAAGMSQPGFPLDDAWIHQTYARNLGENGRWEYVPGAASAGSTSPMWTVLLAVGYLLGVPYLWWAYGLGICMLWLAGWAGMRVWTALWPTLADWRWLAGVALVLTWPLIWAAASGMETMLFVGWGLFMGAQFVNGSRQEGMANRRVAALGVMGGLLIFIRPDGAVLLALIAVGLVVQPGGWLQRLGRGLGVLGTAVLTLTPYLLFNLIVSGTIWPNTFYAKQSEYAVLLAEPLWERIIQLLYFSLGGPAAGWQGSSGAHLLLLPGVLVAVWRGSRYDWSQRRLHYLLPVGWAAGHVVAYAWRLPVTYQHGRYLLTAVPVWVLFGLAGWLLLLNTRSIPARGLRITRMVAGISFGLVLIIFVGLGAGAYGRDVAFINGEMVDVAHWLAANTPPDAVIAAHDIGAIGYFAQRPLLDLAGLISPEVIPLLNDEDALAAYVWRSKATYLVTAPGWPYQTIVADSRAVELYATNYAATVANGLNNMGVYVLKRP